MAQRSLVALLLLYAWPAHAQFYKPQGGGDDDNTPTWTSPDGSFAMRIPAGWNIFINEKDKNTVELKPVDNFGDASLFIRRLAVPPGANPRQLMLNGIEQRLRKLPRFQEGGRREAKINGRNASAVAGIYYFQGNNQFPRAVEEVYFVDDTTGFIIHFECFQPVGENFAPILDRFYKSFIARPPKNLGNVSPGRPPDGPSGLGIDPDRVRY